MANREKFGQFEVAHRADGQMIELPRSPGEMVLIAFDVRLKRLVELHVIKSASKFNARDKHALLELVKIARETANGSFMRILDIGEDDGVPYYSTSLNDGEFLEDYILRRGALPAATAFSLLLPLLDDIIGLHKQPGIAAALSLTRIQIGLLEDTFLHLKGLDFGFSTQVKNDDAALHGSRLVRECCAALFLMLVGKASAGEDCDQYQALTGLPTALRMLMRSSLSMSENASPSIKRFRDDSKRSKNSVPLTLNPSLTPRPNRTISTRWLVLATARVAEGELTFPWLTYSLIWPPAPPANQTSMVL